MKQISLALCALALSLTACSDGILDVEENEPSAVSFEFAGAGLGSFSARGDLQPNRPLIDQTFAAGRRFGSPDAIEVHGFAPRAGNVVDWIDIKIPTPGIRSYAIDATTCHWSDDTCPTVFVVLEMATGSGAQAKYSCQLQTGSIRVRSLTSTRVQGEFSGAGSCLENTGAFAEEFTVSNGRFDVKLASATRG